MTEPVEVKVYVRDGCHLCDEALDAIRSLLASRSGARLEVVDIESDHDLLGRFLERIPVIEVGGEQVGDLVFDRTGFIEALDRAGVTLSEYPA